jgi:hypothetical protein
MENGDKVTRLSCNDAKTSPSCMWHLMARGFIMIIIQLPPVFKKLCPKIMDLTTMEDLKQNVAITLLLLEWKFPSSFLDVITYFLVHLMEEL